MIHQAPRIDFPPALRRLLALAPLDAAAIDAVTKHIALATRVPARHEILSEGEPIKGSKLIVAGWVARTRIFLDGRRQFLSFLLPGELTGVCHQPAPLAVSTLIALTDVWYCPAPSSDGLPLLAQAYAMSHALDEAYLLDHIARLGRLSAQERIYSLLLELNERLSLSGLSDDGKFEMPLTQEAIADALGLTTVHVNRMVQLARRVGDLQWIGGQIALRDEITLADRIGWSPAHVSASAHLQNYK